MALIKADKAIMDEGELLTKWLWSRLMKNNKNVLAAATGPTGSGKSYFQHRLAELWYLHRFKGERFNVERNTCFSIAEVMKRLTEKDPKRKVRKGEILIIEEAGVNMGSLDFQNKVSKLFAYVLQSFRSMNVCLFFNLPYLTMLNKSARTLMHVQFVMNGIDFDTNTAKVKAYFRQVNQTTGKVYEKFMRVNHLGKRTPVKFFSFGLPSEYIINAYEGKKQKFLNDFNEDFGRELEEIDKKNLYKMSRKTLTEAQQEVFELLNAGYNQIQIAEILKKNQSTIAGLVQNIRKRGFIARNNRNGVEKSQILGIKPIAAART